MIAKERTLFGRLMHKLGAVHMREVDQILIDAYFTALKPLSLGAAERAVNRAIQDSPFFPKPAELRALAQSPERPRHQERDGEPVYACLSCRDEGVTIAERFRPDGRSVGTFAKPCTCSTGEQTKHAWEQPDEQGRVLAESAKDNTYKLREMGVKTT